MIEDPSFPWSEFLAYCVAAAMAFLAGRSNARAAQALQAGRALWMICHQAQARGVFFSAWDNAIIEESRRRLK